MIDKRASIPDRGLSVRAVVFDDVAELTPHLPAWDSLAVERGKPFCAPGWMLSWWKEARTGDTRLRVVLVFEGSELVAVGPFFAQVAFGLVELRLLAAGFSHRIGVLARDESTEVAWALALALANIRPRAASVVFEGVDGADPWPELIAAQWPSPKPPRKRIDQTMDAPIIELGGCYEDWLERRERHFRKEARRTARRMEEDGAHGEVRSDSLAFDALVRLHHARWAKRGGSNLDASARAVLEHAAEAFGAEDRLSVALIEAPSGEVAAELFLRAGDTATFWAGGFDPSWARVGPGTQAMLLALRHLAEQGVEVADLGGGAHDYKRHLADQARPIVWRTVFPRGIRYPLIRVRLAPKRARAAIRGLIRHTLPEARARLMRTRSSR